ncbi:MAG: hypothetical protein EXQ93_01465 [Alphaproteobacteria bacterium]|nr:hypothetical protein [Alphaproteobacteria bacterium]
MQGRALTEFTVNWIAPNSARYALTMCSAYVHQFECALLSRLSREANGRSHDEFGLVVESTQGSLRRIDARGAVTTAYSVTPQGARWERRVA